MTESFARNPRSLTCSLGGVSLPTGFIPVSEKWIVQWLTRCVSILHRALCGSSVVRRFFSLCHGHKIEQFRIIGETFDDPVAPTQRDGPCPQGVRFFHKAAQHPRGEGCVPYGGEGAFPK